MPPPTGQPKHWSWHQDAPIRNAATIADRAWSEAFVADLGWVGFDPANGICTTDANARVAVGLDYLGAAPSRGTANAAATRRSRSRSRSIRPADGRHSGRASRKSRAGSHRHR